MESQKPESTNDDPSPQQCAGPAGELGDDALDAVVGGTVPLQLPQLLTMSFNVPTAQLRTLLAPVETQSKAHSSL